MSKYARIAPAGIAAAPSGRLSDDGACSESLNCIAAEGGGLAPMPAPVPDSSLGLPEGGVEGDVMHIHRQPGYANAVCVERHPGPHGTNTYSLAAYLQDGTALDLGGLGSKPLQVSSVGNTLIVSGDGYVEYFLFKDGEYLALGDGIPVPDIVFDTVDLPRQEYHTWIAYPETDPGGGPSKATVALGGREGGFDVNPYEEIGSLPTEVNGSMTDAEKADVERYVALDYHFLENWNKGSRGEAAEPVIAGIVDGAWARLEADMAENAARGILDMPVFARFAVRMYDGTTYGASIPILVRPDCGVSPVACEVKSAMGGSSPPNFLAGRAVFYLSHTLLDAYVLGFRKDGTRLSPYSDLVESVDIFLSAQVTPYPSKRRFMVDNPHLTEQEPTWFQWTADLPLDPWGMGDEEEQRTNIEGYSVMHLVKSYTPEEFDALPEDTFVSLQDDMDLTPDALAATEAFKEEEAYMAGHRNQSFRTYAYNSRSIIYDVTRRLGKGYLHAHGPLPIRQTEPEFEFELAFHIDTGEGVQRVVRTGLTPSVQRWQAWIAYPDSRCTKVDVRIPRQGSDQLLTLEMRAHPSMNIAYAFIGFSHNVAAWGTEIDEMPPDDPCERIADRLLQSVGGNPFVFLASGEVRCGDGTVTGMAAAARPLSSGQFGQYPLYVFTTDGIWAVSVAADGTLSGSAPLSREVAFPGSVAPLDQAVAFIGAKGVMLLAGGDVQCISDAMYGVGDMLPWFHTDVAALVAEREPSLSDVVSLADPPPFLEFCSGASIAYDYAGRRLLLINPAYGSMYVYSLAGRTWHRTDTSAGAGVPVRALNSYPGCLLVCERRDDTPRRQSVHDFSSHLGDEGRSTLPFVFVTRPLGLSGWDAYRTLVRAKVRCRRASGAKLLWMVLASDDLRTWRVLSSLRGPSHRHFRLAVVASLGVGDRLEYVELEYEDRFPGKLR